jgi:GAF domain-containing protein
MKRRLRWTCRFLDRRRGPLEQLDLNYFIPCRIRDHTVAVLGLGKTVDGDFLSSEDIELLFTIAGYVAIALDNAQLYSSLEQKADADRAAERFLREHRRIAERRRAGGGPRRARRVLESAARAT